MGDISRHRDIFLFTRETVPAALLDSVRLTVDDLTYLELGNYLTDVSQFRDPVTYIFAKQRIWRDFVIPQAQDKTQLLRGLSALGAGAALAASQYLKSLTSGTAADVIEGAGIGVAAIGGILALLPSDTYAALSGADTWIDTLLGTPIERTPGVVAQDEKHYGYLGEFFRLFIEGATHFIFAQDVQRRSGGAWGTIKPIPANRVAEVYGEFFTQYYPHEHTDQPPYVWDASKRPSKPLYQPSRRQANLKDGDVGVMNAVDAHYVAYLAEGLARVEDDWRALKRDDRPVGSGCWCVSANCCTAWRTGSSTRTWSSCWSCVVSGRPSSTVRATRTFSSGSSPTSPSTAPSSSPRTRPSGSGCSASSTGGCGIRRTTRAPRRRAPGE